MFVISYAFLKVRITDSVVYGVGKYLEKCLQQLQCGNITVF